MVAKTSSSYFQITPYILIEFVHYDLSNSTEGDVSLGFDNPDFTGFICDIDSGFEQGKSKICVVDDSYSKSKYMFTYDTETPYTMLTNNHKGNNVLPINASCTQFVDPAYDSYLPYTDLYSLSFTTSDEMQVDTTFWLDENTDVWYDTIIVHLTSNSYLQDYESLIFNTYILDAYNNKVNLSSILFNSDSQVFYDSNPLLIGDKMYVKSFKFRIPNVEWLITSDVYGKHQPLLDELFSSYAFQPNCPIYFAIQGVRKSWTNNEGYVLFETEELDNTVPMPYKGKSTDLELRVEKAVDGDYFIMQPVVENGEIEFSDYLADLGGNYTVMHDISLIEYYFDGNPQTTNKIASKLTHREYFVAASGDDPDSPAATEQFNEPIFYRPVLKTTSTTHFVIQDVLRIYDNIDGTTIVKTGMCTYGEDKVNENVGTYGKNIQPLTNMKNATTLSSQLLSVNVYNKRTDIDNDAVTINNTNIGKIESKHTNYNITAFIDAKNIAVSVQNVKVEDRD